MLPRYWGGAISGVPQALCSTRSMVQDENIGKTARTPSKQNMRQLKINSLKRTSVK